MCLCEYTIEYKRNIVKDILLKKNKNYFSRKIVKVD